MDIWPGDFFSTKGKGITGWANQHLTKTQLGSHTDRFHFGILADPVYDTEGNLVDFETRESIAKGPSTLRFFERYQGKDIELYRLPNITREEGLRLARSISKIGTAGYGFKDFLQAGWDVCSLLILMQFPPYTPEQFRVSQNSAYICTELPAYGARAIGHPIEPPDYPDLWVIPAVYLQAREVDRLILYYKGILSKTLLAPPPSVRRI
jgi:hypothetical protein